MVIELENTVRVTEVKGNKDHELYTMSYLYTKVSNEDARRGEKRQLLCQMFGYQPHEVVFAKFVSENNEN